jgi:hypothetical protein
MYTTWPNTGAVVAYNLRIENTTCNPDGAGSRTCMVINGRYPGPTIVANWGDTIRVTGLCLVHQLLENANRTTVSSPQSSSAQWYIYPLAWTPSAEQQYPRRYERCDGMRACAWRHQDLSVPGHRVRHLMVSQSLLSSIRRRCRWFDSNQWTSYCQLRRRSWRYANERLVLSDNFSGS